MHRKRKKLAQGASAVTGLFGKKRQQPTSGKGESSAEAQPAQPDADPSFLLNRSIQRTDKTFRVKGIPLGVSMEEMERLLQAFLRCSLDETGLQCHSLATNHSGTSQDATISFNKSFPPCISTKLPYSNDIGAKDDTSTLALDESFLGFTTLNSCPENGHRVNVVALSGIGAHAFGSFKSRGRSHMWLRDDLPKDLPGSNVMIWGYESTISKSTDTKSIQDISRQLRHDLSQISDSKCSQPFIFVAHSLGGLVLKKLLIDLCNSAKWPNNDGLAPSSFLNLIRGVIFCGVPHFGLETQVINTLVQMAEHQPNEPLLHSIGQDSELLDQMHEQYALLFSKNAYPNSIACCVYETKTSPTAVHTGEKWAMTGPHALFVNKQSATAQRHGDENTNLCMPIDETHSNLVKFQHGSQHYYRIVQVMKDSLAKQAPPIYELNTEERDCLQSLYPGDYKRYKNRNPDRVEGTCRWVLDHQLFTDWLLMDQSTLLWVSADPGCGKSVLAKGLIDRDLVIPDGASLLYFFFKDDDAQQKSSANAVAALLHQLFSIPQLAFLIRHAIPDYRRIGQEFVSSFDCLWEIFCMAVSDPRAGPIYCVMDALDECAMEDREGLLSSLEKSFIEPENSELDTKKVKFLVTSRPYQDIERRFFFLIRLEGEKETKTIKKEIDRVIKHKVPELSQRLRLDPRQQSLLQAKLLSVEHRTYLWLHLVLENLAQSNNFNRKKFDKIIEDLPRSVEAAYEKILSKGDKSEQDRLLQLLQLVVVATRPLSVTELNLILPLRLGDPRSHEEFVHEELESDDQFKTTMRNWCGLFLIVVDDQVYFLHQTAREFLVAKQSEVAIAHTGWNNSVELWKAEFLMTQKCVAYLMFPGFNEFNDDSLASLRKRAPFGFLAYAEKFWPHHFREIQAHEDSVGLLSDAVLKLYAVGSVRFGNLMKICKDGFSSDQTLIMQATELSHHALFRYALKAGHDLEVSDYYTNHTPFVRAVSRGDLTTAKALAELGANIQAADLNGETALSLSSKHTDGGAMLQWLIDSKANLEAKDYKGKSALLHALETNSPNAIQILLKAGADIESKDYESRSILSNVAGSNLSEAVRTLLSLGADCQSEDCSGQTPLMRASQCDSNATDVMELLILHGSDVNKRDNLGRTALHYAFGSSADSSLLNIKVLLGHNALINVRDNYGSTPLKIFLGRPYKMNRLEIVRLFIAWKADVSIKNNHGYTALSSILQFNSLQRTSRSEDQDKDTEEVIRLLLDSGAKVDSIDDTGRTPLFWALEGGPPCLKLADVLLEYGANEGSRVLQGHSIEYWAGERSSPAGKIDMVESDVQEIARARAVEPGVSKHFFIGFD